MTIVRRGDLGQTPISSNMALVWQVGRALLPRDKVSATRRDGPEASEAEAAAGAAAGATVGPVDAAADPAEETVIEIEIEIEIEGGVSMRV